MTQQEAHTILIVTGMSGAGMTTTLKILEDMGYETVDGVPIKLIGKLINPSNENALAIGVDVRTRGFDVDELVLELDRIQTEKKTSVQLLFLDCNNIVIERRYVETRHLHPLAAERPLIDGIRHERQILSPLQDRADLVIDTSDMAIKDIKRILRGHYALDDKKPLNVFVTSFSFRKGIPREADLVFDVRFLKNPYYDPDLRTLTGEDDRVGAHIEEDSGFEDFFSNMTRLIQPLLPRYAQEGKSYLTIAIGCTGGQHRSVYTARKLYAWLQTHHENAQLQHRELTKSAH